MPELYVRDADYKIAGKNYEAKVQEVEGLVETYITTLQSIVDDGILAGETATALLAFSSLAKRYLNQELGGISKRHQRKSASFTDLTETDDDTEIS